MYRSSDARAWLVDDSSILYVWVCMYFGFFLFYFNIYNPVNLVIIISLNAFGVALFVFINEP